jgi:peptidyl-prolyl cis-trans isomerase D
MFEAVRNNKRIVQGILALISISFVFFGIESYLQQSQSAIAVAKVAGTEISQAEFDRALREQQDRLRQSTGEAADSALFRSADFRRAVLDNLINQRLLAFYASKSKLAVADGQLQQAIASIPAFQSDGKFSIAQYEAVVRSQGLSQAAFEARLRRDLALQQVLMATMEAAQPAGPATERLLAAQLETRSVRVMHYAPADFEGQVKLPEGAAKSFYDDNPGAYERAARVKVDYLVLDEAAVAHDVVVSGEEARQWYEAHRDQYMQPEERRVRHILIQTAPDGKDEQIEAARAKAEKLRQTVLADPGSFAKIAKQSSEDSGSAGEGGDLGYFGRGAMVAPFEEAAFALKAGEISDLVRTDFGFHILQLEDIRPARGRSFDEAKAEIAAELRQRAAARRFAESADSFANTVYEQSDSLEPAAKRFGLALQHSDWVDQGATTIGPLDSEKLVKALFSEDALTHKRNTEAIDLGGNRLVAARVVAYEPARRRAFDEVRADIRERLTQAEAGTLAAQAGQAALEALNKGDGGADKWPAAQDVQRGAPVFTAELTRDIFAADAAKLPVYLGGARPGGGFTVVKVEAVKAAAPDALHSLRASMEEQYGRLLGQEDFLAFLASLRSRLGVEVNEAAIIADAAS